VLVRGILNSMRLAYIASFVCVFGLVHCRVSGQDWSLTRVADTTMLVPGESGTYLSIGLPFGSASLADGPTVAFVATGCNAGQGQGVFMGAGGVVSSVANRTTSVPGTPSATFNQGFGRVTFEGSNPTFDGRSGVAGSGAYRQLSPGNIQAIATNQTPIPGGGGGTFTGVSAPYGSGGGIAFTGLRNGPDYGIYRWTAGGINTIVDTTMPMPGTLGGLGQINSYSFAETRLAFRAANAERKGVFSRDASGTGPVGVVADSTVAAPGGGGLFTDFGSISADGPNTSFIAGTSSGSVGTYASLNGQLTRIADSATLSPNGQQFFSFFDTAISGDTVAFVATGPTIGYELWVYRQGNYSRVIGSGDVLGGINVFTISIGPQALRGDTIAFSFCETTGSDPTNRGGVYTATYVPAPGAATILAAAGGWAGRRRRAT
jgi:hypothetical protein